MEHVYNLQESYRIDEEKDYISQIYIVHKASLDRNLARDEFRIDDVVVELSSQLRAFADRLDNLAGLQANGYLGLSRPGQLEIDSLKLIGAARFLYQTRRLRERKLSSDLFGEPAWDMLLDLFIADQMGKRLQVTSVCIGAAVPPTTALRWIGVLQDHGLVDREDDPGDARRTYLTLSKSGRQKMIEIIGALCENLR